MKLISKQEKIYIDKIQKKKDNNFGRGIYRNTEHSHQNHQRDQILSFLQQKIQQTQQIM